ncbi:MAG: hypothetical protein ACFE8N_06335 [Promethearchaeota archaeon]
MRSFKQEFEDVTRSGNSNNINDFLIKLSKNPNKDHLEYLRYLIENSDSQTFYDIVLNLVFVLGEIGNLTSVEDFYLDFLYETYHLSDRWVRDEIIQTITKISNNVKLNENVIRLIGNALNDDFQSIIINALKVLQKFDSLPIYVFKNLFHVLNSKNSEVLEECSKVLDKIYLNSHSLFNVLDQFENYKILKPRGIRALLLIQFDSLIYLESFRAFISSSNWDENYKINYLKEIDTFQRILAKNL